MGGNEGKSWSGVNSIIINTFRYSSRAPPRSSIKLKVVLLLAPFRRLPPKGQGEQAVCSTHGTRQASATDRPNCKRAVAHKKKEKRKKEKIRLKKIILKNIWSPLT